MNFWEAILAELIAAFKGGSTIDQFEHGRPEVSEFVRLAIVVGHNSKARGAFSKWIGSEWDFHKKQAVEIQKAAQGTGVKVRVFYRPAGVSYSKQIEAVSGEVNTWGAEYVVSLHFNSFDTDAANGTETLWTGNDGSRELAETMQQCQLDCFGLKDRGLKAVSMLGRGGPLLWGVEAPAVILEPGFGSNKADALAMKKHWPRFAKDLIWAVQKVKS